ncbi:multidrug ABC transporter ATPase [Pseudomonas saudimassiliensis]|uniref:Multidrug ABC transporter ATPase n=1 Tax=Pseudomonas saudimassiliensis TaxID=1461581 RepID=A0A078M7T0_9PSED|nr:ABC transporter ATP-binding protein [Pseudomonas saudimassiliensis]CEA03488.1 multidrug ABC transporter ATPase [Pseudomonas saudimassiliensis]CEF26208.1 multidrug ABC transporter ATPase [Pseudomonas saudimassiliensis]
MNAVDIRGVSKRYGAMTALHQLDLQLEPGEVLGLFGHNGAGKTTTMKLILGLLTPTEGQVRVLGGRADTPEIRRQLGYLPENVMFYPQLTGRETLHHFARIKGAARQQADDLLEQVGLAHAADRRVKTYSKGMRQRLGLAQALLGDPQLLLLDEPTVGLDPIATQDLYLLIDTLRQQGTSVVLCSHVLPGVEAHINRAAILAAGRLEASGTLASLRSEAGLPARIRASGLQHRDQLLATLSAAGNSSRALGSDSIELVGPSAGKIPLLRQLLEQDQPSDIEIIQPSLEDLYRYYTERANQTQAREETA